MKIKIKKSGERGQERCVQRMEVIVVKKKKKIFFGGRGGGLKEEANEEVKL